MREHAVVIGTNNHLPEGSPPSLFEQTYQVCWRPWLSTLYRFPDIASAIHYSGTVLAWLQAHHPEFIMLLEEMSSRKQIEVIGGGYFAPIMPIIPSADRVGQLEFLSTLIRKLLGRRPRGAWLHEFAWEPSLVSTYNACGFDYTFLPAALFVKSGLDPAQPVLTEDQGKNLCVFPVIDPQGMGDQMTDLGGLFRHHFDERNEAKIGLLMISDVNLVQTWQNSTFESPDVLYETMFASLRKAGDIIETVLPMRWMRTMDAPARGYFSCSCSPRLAAACSGPSLKGLASEDLVVLTPRRLLLQHPESRALYSKMQFVRILVGQLRGDKSRKKSAQEEVWRAQCGDAYWEGAAGGILTLSVRSAAWSALIEAERFARQKGSFVPGIIRADIDLDGEKEILFQGVNYDAHVRLGEAALAEFDSFKSLTNYINSMDGEQRGDCLECFVDSLDDKRQFSPRKARRGFSAYQLQDGGKPSMTASFKGKVSGDSQGGLRDVDITKIYSFRRENLGLSWNLINETDETASFRFVTELNLTAGKSGLDSAVRAGERVANGFDVMDAPSLLAFSFENSTSRERLDFRSDSPFALLTFPLALPSLKGEAGASEWQGTRLLIGWDVNLEAGAIETISLTLELAQL
ncbi:MAG: DUF1925 domain-containing protein [Treponema sp.]|nr:DUF1925 domain-containing protein [Treponema sp.]